MTLSAPVVKFSSNTEQTNVSHMTSHFQHIPLSDLTTPHSDELNTHLSK